MLDSLSLVHTPILKSRDQPDFEFLPGTHTALREVIMA